MMLLINNHRHKKNYLIAMFKKYKDTSRVKITTSELSNCTLYNLKPYTVHAK